MRQRLPAIFFLVMMMVIQMGNVGFSFYEVTCANSNSTNYSLLNNGCTCSSHEAKEDKKSCCKKKTSTCCSGADNDETVIKTKCCSTEKHSFITQSSDFDQLISDFQIENKVFFPAFTIISNQVNHHVTNTNQLNKYHCNSPPLTNYTPRIFIQSFQI